MYTIYACLDCIRLTAHPYQLFHTEKAQKINPEIDFHKYNFFFVPFWIQKKKLSVLLYVHFNWIYCIHNSLFKHQQKI